MLSLKSEAAEQGLCSSSWAWSMRVYSTFWRASLEVLKQTPKSYTGHGMVTEFTALNNSCRTDCSFSCARHANLLISCSWYHYYNRRKMIPLCMTSGVLLWPGRGAVTMSLLLPVSLHTAFDLPSLKITGGTTFCVSPLWWGEFFYFLSSCGAERLSQVNSGGPKFQLSPVKLLQINTYSKKTPHAPWKDSFKANFKSSLMMKLLKPGSLLR